MTNAEPRKDYSIYDARYVDLRREGKSGWVDTNSANWEIHLSALQRVLSADFCPDAGFALDAGCGAGCWSFVLADQGYHVTGIDLSTNSIAWARERALQRPASAMGSVEFHVSSATELGWLKSDHFDFVLDGFLLHCLVGTDRHEYLRQVHRILSPDGVFFVQSFCAEDVLSPEWRDWHIDPQTRYQMDENGVATKYVANSDSILEDLRNAGFDPVENWLTPIEGGMLQVACRLG